MSNHTANPWPLRASDAPVPDVTPPAAWDGHAPGGLCITAFDLLGTIEVPDELIIHVEEDTGED